MSEFDTQKGKYVTFKSGDEYFGLKIQYVNEIIGFQEITEIPESVDYLKGLINLRGKIIPVIDVSIRFKQDPIEYTDRTCIIVINYGEQHVGLIVEKIAEVVEIQEENILPAPSIGSNENAQNKYVYGIGKVGEEVKLLLDPDKLLHDEEWMVNVNDEESEEEEGESENE